MGASRLRLALFSCFSCREAVRQAVKPRSPSMFDGHVGRARTNMLGGWSFWPRRDFGGPCFTVFRVGKRYVERSTCGLLAYLTGMSAAHVQICNADGRLGASRLRLASFYWFSCREAVRQAVKSSISTDMSAAHVQTC